MKKNIFKYTIIGIILFSMVFSVFAALISAVSAA